MKNRVIEYRFRLPSDEEELFRIELDSESLRMVGGLPDECPQWTELDFHQCPNCPLDSSVHKHCPLALRLVNIISRFDHVLSYEEIQLDVYTEERHISQRASAQRGLSSLIGLVSATSGCPHTEFFKPMARFHLPLASRIDTVYRAASMYLLAQFFLRTDERPADLELEGLKKVYREIEIVNISLAERLRAAGGTDSPVNAIVILDTFAKALPLALQDSLKEIRSFFSPYLD